MRVYLAGGNGKNSIIPALKKGEKGIIVYLAGGISGNLNPAWKKMTENTPDEFIKSLASEKFLSEEDIPFDERDISSLYRPDAIQKSFNREIYEHRPYILESFYYADKGIERLLPYFGDFLLDSGAFTFMQSRKNNVDWEEYLERYADFIKRNKIQKYFELDIDTIVGYEKVKEYRKKLEDLIGWQSIPVWHRYRGYQEWLRLCKEYSYVAIGGIAIKEIQKQEYPAFSKMLKDAHERNCKVHGLGFTQLSELKKYKFDSVDSTAWTAGNRFGYLYYFDGKTMKKIHKKENEKIINPRKAALINYIEWIKFQKYAEANL